MTAWVIRISIMDAEQLAGIRHHRDCKVATRADQIWLKLTADELPLEIKTLPGQILCVDRENRLIPIGKQVPIKHLPELNWTPIQKWIDVHCPPAAIAITDSEMLQADFVKPRLRLVRGGSLAKTNGILTTLQHLDEYVDTAPDLRLKKLTFAVADDQRTLVMGEPLPAISGQQFVLHRIESRCLAVPAGYHWTPRLDTETAFDVVAEDYGTTLWLPDDFVEFIPNDAITGMTRSAVRNAFANGPNQRARDVK